MLVCHYLALLHTTSKWFNVTVLENPPQSFNEGLLEIRNTIITNEDTRKCDILIKYRNAEHFGSSCERRRRGQVDLKRLCILSEGPKGGAVMMSTDINCHQPAEVYFDPGDNSKKVATNSMMYILMTYHGLMPEVVTSLEMDPQKANYTTSVDSNSTMSFGEALKRIKTSRTWKCHKKQTLVSQTVILTLFGLTALCALVCLTYTSYVLENSDNTRVHQRPRARHDVITTQNERSRRMRGNAMEESYSNSYRLYPMEDVPPPYSA